MRRSRKTTLTIRDPLRKIRAWLKVKTMRNFARMIFKFQNARNIFLNGSRKTGRNIHHEITKGAASLFSKRRMNEIANWKWSIDRWNQQFIDEIASHKKKKKEKKIVSGRKVSMISILEAILGRNGAVECEKWSDRIIRREIRANTRR